MNNFNNFNKSTNFRFNQINDQNKKRNNKFNRFRNRQNQNNCFFKDDIDGHKSFKSFDENWNKRNRFSMSGKF